MPARPFASQLRMIAVLWVAINPLKKCLHSFLEVSAISERKPFGVDPNLSLKSAIEIRHVGEARAERDIQHMQLRMFRVIEQGQGIKQPLLVDLFGKGRVQILKRELQIAYRNAIGVRDTFDRQIRVAKVLLDIGEDRGQPPCPDRAMGTIPSLGASAGHRDQVEDVLAHVRDKRRTVR